MPLYWEQTTTGTTNDVWPYWVGADTGATNHYAVTVWGNWVDSSQTASTTTWTSWNQTSTTIQWGNNFSFRETEEQRTARREESNRRYEETLRLQKEAKAKAEALLREVLTEEQEKEYDEKKMFHVKVRDPRDRRFRTFRVSHGKAGNITELDENGRPVSKYCIHLYDGSPDEDSMVAQKLLMETDLEAFERIANRSTAYA